MNKKEKIEEVMVEKEKFEIAISDIKKVSCFLEGMEVLAEGDNTFLIGQYKHKLTNAIQWLHNWGTEKK